MLLDGFRGMCVLGVGGRRCKGHVSDMLLPDCRIITRPSRSLH